MDNPSEGKDRILWNNGEDPAHNEETSVSTLATKRTLIVTLYEPVQSKV